MLSSARWKKKQGKPLQTKKKKTKLKRLVTKKYGFGKALYRRTKSNAPIEENCQLRRFDKYFSSYFLVIL